MAKRTARKKYHPFWYVAVLIFILPVIVIVAKQQQHIFTNAQSVGFTTLPPRSNLPSDEECASKVRRSSWEPRPENKQANNTNVYSSGYRMPANAAEGYGARVTGNFTGTTDEIIQWGACKWGFDEENVRAQAVSESRWRQSMLGDCRGNTQPETNGCQSVGLLQVKGADIPPTHPGTWPYALTSTAFNVDYTLAVRRACFEGKETWLGGSYKAGDEWGCIGRWYSGNWHDSSAEKYVSGVKKHLADKPWNTYGGGTRPENGSPSNELITPTFGAIGPCTNCEATPTTAPEDVTPTTARNRQDAMPDQTNINPETNNNEENKYNQGEDEEPCSEIKSDKSHRDHHDKHKEKRESSGGFLESFLRLLIGLINALLQRVGGEKLASPFESPCK